MGLVDYSDSDEAQEATPRAKRQKTTSSSDKSALPKTAKDVLPPPLPSAFHDLYASTVRVSASDDPTLHQGRKRVNPHKVGHWPSHLYIEWHPTATEQETLTTLLSTLQSNLNLTSPSLSSPNKTPITSFLASDLGIPQPLHISLSRPIVLSTAQNDNFLSDLESRIRNSSIAPFELAPLGLQWHRTEESARSFLVLRVGSNPHPSAHKREKQLDDNEDNQDNDKSAAKVKDPSTFTTKPSNPQLKALLHRTNAAVTAFGQPALYAWATPPEGADGGGGSIGGSSSKEKTQEDTTSTVDDAFHISIAWSFAAPSADLCRLTEETFNSARDGTSTNTKPGGDTTTIGDAVRGMRVRVDGIKAKIGNVVTHIPLSDPRNRRNDGKSRGLFGID